MVITRRFLLALAGWLGVCFPLGAWQAAIGPSAPRQEDSIQRQVSLLVDMVAAQGRRIKDLEEQLALLRPVAAVRPAAVGPAEPAPPPVIPAETPAAAEVLDSSVHDHMIQLPGGGPELKIRGYMDFSADIGRAANHLIFPLGADAHNSFQLGEFDLFLSSKLSNRLSVVSELVVGPDTFNAWGLEVERLQLTYRHNRYLEISGGRYHTAIGYYNTAFHHGTWFQTATGRPFMYLFEDSGGILPTHNVGITATGLVPRTGDWNLHWVAEAGNGRTAARDGAPVQNFLSDRNHKAVNFAAYIRPAWASGLQIGASYYRDRLFPPDIPGAKVTQSIESAYLVWTGSRTESLNECVLLNNELESTGRVYRTPMCYMQISERLHNSFRPYFRYQYLNSPNDDPVNAFTGRYQGPSAGIRFDFSAYVALKLQYNRIDQRNQKALNGLQAQAAFAF